MTSDPNLVWSSLLDNRYTVSVHRTRSYHGELTIAEGERILYRKAVLLAYDSLFGPDVDDVNTWEGIAIEFIDNHVN